MNYEYVDSHIEWISQYPKHWKIDRIKDKTINVVGGDWGDDPESDKNGENIVVLRVADLDNICFNYDNLTIRKIKDNSYKSRKITKRCLVIEKSGGGEKQLVGRVGMPKGIDFKAVCSNFMAKIEFDNTVDVSFMNYIFYSLYSNNQNFPFVQQTTGIQNLNVGYYLTTKVLLPPKNEQEFLAEYLDKACEKIDNTIKIKEQQIQEINRYKQSRFFEVLMRGLKQEESQSTDVLWMPKIPISWKIKRIKDISHLKSGDGITSLQINDFDTYPVYGGNGLRGYTSSYTHEGDFVLIGRQGALCGNINYANGVFWASEHAVVCRPIKTYDVYWFGEMLRLMNLNQYSNAAAQPGLAVEKVKNLKLPFPPYNEQVEITKVLKNISTTTDNLIQKLKSQIKTLKDYRKSLIFECVTGKKQIYKGEI